MVALFIILTIIVFLTVDHFVQRWQVARAEVESLVEGAEPALEESGIPGCSLV